MPASKVPDGDAEPLTATPVGILSLVRASCAGRALVREENPCQNDYYMIVFSEERAMFGSASVGFASDQHPVVCGYYGDFPTTLANM